MNETQRLLNELYMINRQLAFGGKFSELEEDLIRYVKKGNYSMVESILAMKPAIDHTIKGKTAIEYACDKRYYDIVDMLLDAGANTDGVSEKCL